MLINTGGSASGGPSLSSFLPSDGQPCQTDLILAVSGKTNVQTNIQYSHIDQSFDTFSLKSDKAEAANVDTTIDKLVSYIDKQQVFKLKSTKYNVSQHGPLSLVVFYGRIGINPQKTLPEKLGELQKLIEEQHDQLIRFFDATVAELSLNLVSVHSFFLLELRLRLVSERCLSSEQECHGLRIGMPCVCDFQRNLHIAVQYREDTPTYLRVQRVGQVFRPSAELQS